MQFYIRAAAIAIATLTFLLSPFAFNIKIRTLGSL